MDERSAERKRVDRYIELLRDMYGIEPRIEPSLIVPDADAFAESDTSASAGQTHGSETRE